MLLVMKQDPHMQGSAWILKELKDDKPGSRQFAILLSLMLWLQTDGEAEGDNKTVLVRMIDRSLGTWELSHWQKKKIAIKNTLLRVLKEWGGGYFDGVCRQILLARGQLGRKYKSAYLNTEEVRSGGCGWGPARGRHQSHGSAWVVTRWGGAGHKRLWKWRHIVFLWCYRKGLHNGRTQSKKVSVFKKKKKKGVV